MKMKQIDEMYELAVQHMNEAELNEVAERIPVDPDHEFQDADDEGLTEEEIQKKRNRMKAVLAFMLMLRQKNPAKEVKEFNEFTDEMLDATGVPLDFANDVRRKLGIKTPEELLEEKLLKDTGSKEDKNKKENKKTIKNSPSAF